jgi:ABC-type lipoprotein release transport system permease subunit
MVAELQAMGASRQDIVRVFLFAGLAIGIVGTVARRRARLLACWALARFRSSTSERRLLPVEPAVRVVPADVLLVVVLDLACACSPPATRRGGRRGARRSNR